jgi:hypothetical protein
MAEPDLKRWSIGEDGDGNLVFKGPEGGVTFSPTGKLTSSVGDVVHVGDTIMLTGRAGASLNATGAHGDGDHPDGWKAWAYWMSGYDGDSVLTIKSPVA